MLAKELGMTVRQLLLTIDSKELSEWAGYYSLEPFGSLREHDVPAGIIASTIANCNRAKHSKSFKPEDFMPFYKKESTVMAEDEMKNVMRMMAQKQKEKNNG